MGMVSKEELRAEWTAKVEAYKASGQTQLAFSEGNGLHLKQLSYWIRKIRKEEVSEKATQWMPVEVHDHNSNYQNSLLNIRLGQVVIEVTPGFNQKHLQDVVRALSQLC